MALGTEALTGGKSGSISAQAQQTKALQDEAAQATFDVAMNAAINNIKVAGATNAKDITSKA